MKTKKRLAIENCLMSESKMMIRDWLKASSSDKLNAKKVEMGLVEYFMDKIDGEAAPLKEFRGFIKELAANYSSGAKE